MSASDITNTIVAVFIHRLKNGICQAISQSSFMEPKTETKSSRREIVNGLYYFVCQSVAPCALK